MADLSLAYSWWYLPLCLLAGAGVAALLYFRNQRTEFATATRVGLALLRGAAISVLCFLLLEPIIRLVASYTEKPVVVLLRDASLSMVDASKEGIEAEVFSDEWLKLERQLSEKFDVEFVAFGDEVRSEDGPDTTFNDGATDLAQAASYLSEVYAYRNLAGVILFTDGISNRGLSPRFEFRRLAAPVYTLASGDTTIPRDLAIDRVLHNKLAYRGNKFPVEVNLRATRLEGTATQLLLYQGDSLIERKSLTVNQNNFQIAEQFLVEANRQGLQQYTAVVSAVQNEVTTANNRAVFYLDILENRRKILLAAHAPHPDLHALTAALEGGDNFEVDVHVAGDAEFPSDIEAYSLAMLHQLPSTRNPSTALFRDLEEAGLPVWVFAGERTQVRSLQNLVPVLSFDNVRQGLNEATAGIPRSFNTFVLGDSIRALLPRLPALKLPNATISAASGAQIALEEMAGSLSTGLPVMASMNQNDRKMAVLAAEGVWQWRLATFRATGSHRLFDEWIRRWAQYLATVEDKRRFRIEAPRQLTEGENAFFQAEVYDASFTPDNSAEVELVLTDSAGAEFPYVFSRNGNAYTLQAGQLKPGVYSWQASAPIDGVPQILTGSFSVAPSQLEQNNLIANFQLLQAIADDSEGAFFTWTQRIEMAETLLSSARSTPLLYERERFEDLLNWWWLALLLAGLLSAEWFIRKRAGSY